ncbi:MAG: hypothetical protein FJ306_02085 [Planctomycetes bacterium]|nr:hypothetical protein [Planctomycetota bacterium]
MDPQSPLHPLFVHLPLALATLAPALFGALWLAIRCRWLPLRARRLAIAAQAALVGSAGLAMTSGEEDAERVERVVAEAAIDRHEERTEWFLGGGIAVLLLAGRLPRAGAIAADATTAAAGPSHRVRGDEAACATSAATTNEETADRCAAMA